MLGAWKSDQCKLKYGESYLADYYGCPDTDKDGYADDIDPCPYDPKVGQGVLGTLDDLALIHI